MKTIELIFLFSIPFIFGVIAITEEFIKYILGDKWYPIMIPLFILLWFSLFRSLMKVTGLLFQAIGKPEITMKINMYEFILLATLIIPLTLRAGIIGASIANTIPMALASIYGLIMIKKILEIDLLMILKTFVSIMICSSLMYALILFIKTQLFIVNSLFDLIILVIMGILIYIFILLILDKKRLLEIREIVSMTFK